MEVIGPDLRKLKHCYGTRCTIENKNIWVNKKVDKRHMFKLNPLEKQSPNDIYLHRLNCTNI